MNESLTMIKLTLATALGVVLSYFNVLLVPIATV